MSQQRIVNLAVNTIEYKKNIDYLQDSKEQARSQSKPKQYNSFIKSGNKFSEIIFF